MFLTHILVCMSDCLLADGLSNLFTSQYGFCVNKCDPADIELLKVIEETQPHVIILNQECEESKQSVLPHLLDMKIDFRVLVVNSENNFLQIIDHKFHRLNIASELFLIAKPI